MEVLIASEAEVQFGNCPGLEEEPLVQISWQQGIGMLLALPWSLHATATPSLCWCCINSQNVICATEEPGAFLKLLLFSIWELLEKKLPIFMLYFSSYNRFGNNWGSQQQSLENLQFSFIAFQYCLGYTSSNIWTKPEPMGLTTSEGGTLVPLNHAFFSFFSPETN